MLIVGLTGGIACGKSTVSRRLKEHHKLPIVDADKIAREVVLPGTKTYQKIVDYFEDKLPDLLLEDGNLNRPSLGKWVFSNPSDLKMLNGITHSAIRYKMCEEMMSYYIKGYSVCIMDVPLLFESKLDVFCGVTVNVICDEETQLERLQIRNTELSIEDARQRIKAQMPMNERIQRTDYLIENNGTLTELYDQVDDLIKKIKPTFVRTALEYFPPFGIVSGGAIVMSRLLMSKIKNEAI
ncbi:hypothetical protein KAFR_0B06190 [Kazachstania africana CBS 2517]|uniref:Dephospho-CoA kinase n=1 Tax=Kazachstania africana (strain ATCC 22294 / BCRC 22015 / CBS 2517 / CECT 1963 / NBRC 1671 / NRRL Y-8276) TaxID=1071382 RepID=H2ARB6_KAZAF|nr:hypothetical protein KAFR_0B06190 [Kazachstania africana CBS 2517]CCF56916.1 hypothetical protein KAFR_0B06190 [Kazachstania africana CBS 2517]